MSTTPPVPPPDPDAPVDLGKVLEAERLQIEEVRRRRHGPSFASGTDRSPVRPPEMPIAGRPPIPSDHPDWQRTDKDWVRVIAQAHKANYVGLAFSGGGIRSATFNLGVLQGLADLKLLFRVDYLSTVSGGGYIGSWLTAWTKRLQSFAAVQKRLSTSRVHQLEDREPDAVRFLRMFSNYLTPKLGVFRGDTWAMVFIYLRNLLLNQTVLFTMVAFLLLLPRVLNRWAVASQSCSGPHLVLLWAMAVLLLIAFLLILINMGYLDSPEEDPHKGPPHPTEQKWVLLLVCVPLFGASILAAIWPSVRYKGAGEDHPVSYFCAAILAALGYFVFWLAGILGDQIYRAWLAEWLSEIADDLAILRGRLRPEAKKKTTGAIAGAPLQWQAPVAGLLSAAVAGVLAGCLYTALSRWTVCWEIRYVLTAAIPLTLGIFLLAGVLHIGLMGIWFRDWKREWWGRLGGLLLIFGLTWLGIFWIALCFPDFIRHNTFVKATWQTIAAKYLTPAWILSTVASVFAGKSKASGEPGNQNWVDLLAKVGPYVFMAGLLCWISWGLDVLLLPNDRLYAALGICAAVALFMAWRVDINQFSMHLFYRNRLVRCYLGASNEARSANRFTGFDPNDEVHLKDLRVDVTDTYDGPYPVLNTTLNLVKGKDLAWQERKAESFVMTPLYCGYDVWLEEKDSPMLMRERPMDDEELRASDQKRLQARGKPDSATVARFRDFLRGRLRNLDRFGYRPTKDYIFPPPFHGPNLGLAMAISGAAASPNMGYYSSAPVAFLLTVFNVRLGQWLGNPRHRKTWQRPTPPLGLFYLLRELFAGTDDEAPYVYLSDGGHFDNLGLYELVKRRCGLIIVGDAEGDSHFGYGNLGNAIRKCRIDLGIDIDLDVSEITPEKDDSPSKKHFAVGTIHYEQADIHAPTGTIIYFKSSLTGDESIDLKNYKKQHASFPYESTIDQWFSESQFESYRQLGHHVVFESVRAAFPEAPGLWSALTSSLREAFHEVTGGQAKCETPKPESPEQKLRKALKDFNFETAILEPPADNSHAPNN